MIILEIPIWLLISFVVLFALMVIHLIVGDLLASIILKYIKSKTKEDE